MSKTIIITGASSGIGAACAKHAVESGHQVVLAARSADKLKQLAAELGHDNALGVECDVTDADSQKEMFKKAKDRFGSIDVVYANAGLGSTGDGTENGEDDNFLEMIMVNNYAVTLTSKYAIPHLKESSGQLLLTGSQAGHVSIPGSVYGATKWFVRGYAKNLAAELEEHGVRVSSIDPGMVSTPFFKEEKTDALHTDDVARAFLYAIEQPKSTRIATIEIQSMS